MNNSILSYTFSLKKLTPVLLNNPWTEAGLLNLGRPIYPARKGRGARERGEKEVLEDSWWVRVHTRGFHGWKCGALTPRLRHILRPVVPQLQLRRMRAQPPPCRLLQLRRLLAVPLIVVSSATVRQRLPQQRPETTTMTRHARLKQARRQTERMISARNDTNTIVPRGSRRCTQKT